MYLFFDTETTGLPGNWKAPVTDLNNWPRLVQLAYLVYDSEGNKIDEGDFIIKPEGFTIPSDATRIHGITTERALKEGISLSQVLKKFHLLITQAEFLVAHNMSFDEKIIGAEFLRLGIQNSIPAKKKICTMESSTFFCAIDGPYGYKWPKLTELHHKLFNTDFEEAHNAMGDIQATSRCFWELVKKDVIKLNNPIKSITPENYNPTSVTAFEDFNDPLEAVNETEIELIPYLKGSKWGLCTRDKTIVIDCIYERVKQFSEGFSAVKLNKKWGFINNLGEIVIPFDYRRATSFKNNIAYVVLNDHLYKINKNIELELVRRKYEWEWWGYPVDDNFEESVELLLEDIGHYLKIGTHGKNNLAWQISHEGSNEVNEMIPFIQNKKFGFKSSDNSVIISAIFDDGFDFERGLGYVKYKEKWGYIDKSGNQYWED